jgi:hypothetical protein
MKFNLPVLSAVRRFKDLVEVVPNVKISDATTITPNSAHEYMNYLYVTKSTVFQSVKPLCAAASMMWRTPPTTVSSTGLKVDKPCRESFRKSPGIYTQKRTSFKLRGGCCGT